MTREEVVRKGLATLDISKQFDTEYAINFS